MRWGDRDEGARSNKHSGDCHASTYIDKQLEIQPQAGNLNVLGRFTKSLGGGWQAIVTASLFRSEAEQIGGHAVLNPDNSPNAELEPGGTPTLVNSSLFPITVPAS
jgi:hypothetical protein